jgi:hypothetical protein
MSKVRSRELQFTAGRMQKARDQRIGAVHFGADKLATSRASFSLELFARALPADALMVPSGLRSSCARPAVS